MLNSRGIEAMAITPNGRDLVVVVEGAVVGDDPLSRRIYRYRTVSGRFTRLADYHTDDPVRFIADAQALDDHRLVVIERDGGRGATATARPRLRVSTSNPLVARRPRPWSSSWPRSRTPIWCRLPAIHAGDIGLGDPFQVTCESIEALHVISGAKLLFGCDNNFPNMGRNPALADDSEFIVVKVPGLTHEHDDREG